MGVFSHLQFEPDEARASPEGRMTAICTICQSWQPGELKRTARTVCGERGSDTENTKTPSGSSRTTYAETYSLTACLKVRSQERHLARLTTTAGRALRRLRPCRPSRNPTRIDLADGTSPLLTRYTPDTHNPPHSWDRDFVS